MAEPADRILRALEVGVLAPIGLAAVVHEQLPKLTERGRERVEQRIVVARFIGAMVVAQGRRELERRLHPPASIEAAPSTGSPDRSPHRSVNDDLTAATLPSARDLPIDDYESLSASQVIPLLLDLASDDLDRVETFERSHRGRRTVLGRIAQLRDAP